MEEKPLYVISIVSDLLGLHPQTLRQYERLGFIDPSRTVGNTRLYSENDIEKLRKVIILTKENGVNLAGVEIILQMQKEIDNLNDQINVMISSIKNDFDSDKTTRDRLPINKVYTKVTIIKE